MAPFREINSYQQRQRYIKKGRIHSQKALKRRAEEWMERWNCIIGLSNRVLQDRSFDDEGTEKSLEHSYSMSPESLNGFEFQGVHECITLYSMTRQQIENLEMEVTLTTDEEDDDEDEKSLSPISLCLEYSDKQKKLKLCPSNSDRNSVDKEILVNSSSASASLTCRNINGSVASSYSSYDIHIKVDPALSTSEHDENINCETASSILSKENNINNDDMSIHLSPGENVSPNETNSNKGDCCDPDERDPEIERTRPVSKISLVIHPYDDDIDDDDISDCETERPLSRMSRSGYMSFFETDFEDDDDDVNNEIIVKTRKPGQGVYGKIPGINVGTAWKNRRQFSRRSVHRPQNAVIHGGPKGAYSMVLSATYSVNDRGEEFDFYGEGGRDPKTKKHVRDQRMERGNLSLRENIQTGTPVRVIRGCQLQNMFAPEVGYRYDGLYEVTQCTMDRKIDGFKVFMFTFARCGHQPPPPWHISSLDLPLPSPSSVDHHLSDSDDDINPENERHKKPNRKKRKRSAVPEISRCSTPLSNTSDDIPPELHLPENNEACPIVYPIPPHLSLSISNGIFDIQKRPVLCLEKLNASITAEAVVKPVNVKDVRLINMQQNVRLINMQQNVKKMKSKLELRIKILGKKKKTYNKNKNTPTLNANILKKEKKKTKNIKTVNIVKKKLNKKEKHKTKGTVERKSSDQPSKKKQGSPKIRVTKGNTSRVVAKKKTKSPPPKVTLKKNKINVKKSPVKCGVKKGISIKDPIKKKKGHSKSATGNTKSTNSKKNIVLTKEKAASNKTSVKKKKKIILKKDVSAQGEKTASPSHPDKKRGRKRKNPE